MEEDTPIDAVVERKILQARLDEIARYEKRESRALGVFQTTLLGIAAIFVVVQYFNIDTLMGFISNAENNLDKALSTADFQLKTALDDVDDRLAAALHDTEPERAMLEPLYTEYNENTIVYDAHIYPWDDNAQRYYGVELTGNFYTHIVGPPGRLTGLLIKNSGSIIEYVARTRLGEFDYTAHLIMTTGHYSPEGAEYGGNLITEFAPFLSVATIKFPAKNCAKAVSLINEMAKRKDLGKIFIKPIFARIRNIPVFQEFNIRVKSKLSHSCEELELGRKID